MDGNPVTHTILHGNSDFQLRTKRIYPDRLFDRLRNPHFGTSLILSSFESRFQTYAITGTEPALHSILRHIRASLYICLFRLFIIDIDNDSPLQKRSCPIAINNMQKYLILFFSCFQKSVHQQLGLLRFVPERKFILARQERGCHQHSIYKRLLFHSILLL